MFIIKFKYYYHPIVQCECLVFIAVEIVKLLYASEPSCYLKNRKIKILRGLIESEFSKYSDITYWCPNRIYLRVHIEFLRQV